MTRLVFDCTARPGITSLNFLLLPGPDLAKNLTGVLLRFRQEPIAFLANVEQMFQVGVAPFYCHPLRFLWWQYGDFSEGHVDH